MSLLKKAIENRNKPAAAPTGTFLQQAIALFNAEVITPDYDFDSLSDGKVESERIEKAVAYAKSLQRGNVKATKIREPKGSKDRLKSYVYRDPSD